MPALAWGLAGCTIVAGLIIGWLTWMKRNQGLNEDCHEEHYWAGMNMDVSWRTLVMAWSTWPERCLNN